MTAAQCICLEEDRNKTDQTSELKFSCTDLCIIMINKKQTMIKIGKDIRKFSTYSCQPQTKFELKNIINERISKEGPRCNLNDIDVTLIEDMAGLFDSSDFNGDISEWDTSNVKYMTWMFANSNFNSDISNWNVSKVKYMAYMFACSKFDQNISNWKIKDECKTMQMFRNCGTKEEFKPKSLQK